jgi:hypothetical protein
MPSVLVKKGSNIGEVVLKHLKKWCHTPCLEAEEARMKKDSKK